MVTVIGRHLFLFGLAGLLAACASVPREAVTELAPSGTLQVAINIGNPILASQDPVTKQARGVSVDLARELGKRLEVPVKLVTFASAGQAVEAIRGGKVDIVFVAIDPVRGADIGYSAAYVVIEGAYMVRNESPLQDNAQVDKAGIRVAVGAGSAYDLFLKRELKAATLVRAPTSPTVVDLFLAQNLDVAAGVKQQLEMDAKRVSGVRLLPGNFMEINQAMGTPKTREAGVKYLREFVEDMKRSGFVAQALVRHKIEGAAIAPPVADY
jgi:polar amino acid transport system substrate-binding protein